MVSIINAAGDIGGTLSFNCNAVATNLTGAHWTPGGVSVTSLGTYDLCSSSYVLGMNNVGDLAGFGYKIIGGLNWTRATIWRAGTTIELPNFGTSPAHARVNSINDSGIAVGYSESHTPSSWWAPALWTAGGSLVNLNTPADPTYPGEAKSINNAGLIVGTSGVAPASPAPSRTSTAMATPPRMRTSNRSSAFWGEEPAKPYCGCLGGCAGAAAVSRRLIFKRTVLFATSK
jgi:hypothetical protein